MAVSNHIQIVTNHQVTNIVPIVISLFYCAAIILHDSVQIRCQVCAQCDGLQNKGL